MDYTKMTEEKLKEIFEFLIEDAKGEKHAAKELTMFVGYLDKINKVISKKISKDEKYNAIDQILFELGENLRENYYDSYRHPAAL